MNIIPLVASKRPTSSLNHSDRGTRATSQSERRSPVLADHEIRDIVAAMIG